MPFAILSVILALWSPQDPTDPSIIAAGRKIASRFCGECHATGQGESSRMQGAPAFADLGRVYPVNRLSEALEKDWLSASPHMKPFDLGPDERMELQAYVMALQGYRSARP